MYTTLQKFEYYTLEKMKFWFKDTSSLAKTVSITYTLNNNDACMTEKSVFYFKFAQITASKALSRGISK